MIPHQGTCPLIESSFQGKASLLQILPCIQNGVNCIGVRGAYKSAVTLMPPVPSKYPTVCFDGKHVN